MNNFNHILKIVLLITIYCFGVSVSAINLKNSNFNTVQNTSEQQDYLVKNTKIHFLHTIQSENILPSGELNISPEFKLSFDDFIKHTVSQELQYLSQFRQYNNHLQTIRVRFRKSDLIFPFHNFW